MNSFNSNNKRVNQQGLPTPPVEMDRDVEDDFAIIEYLEDNVCLSKNDGAKVQRATRLQKPGVGIGLLIKPCTRVFVKSGHQSVGKFQITDIVQGGGVWDTGQIQVYDCIVAVAATPDQAMVVHEDIDHVHDAILGLEGTDLILQVEKHSSLSLINVNCTRKVVRPESINAQDQGVVVKEVEVEKIVEVVKIVEVEKIVEV